MARTVNSEQFKEALSNLPTGVTVITNNYNNQLFGLTVSSFTSVSLLPPLVLFCLDKKSSNIEAFSNSNYFAISILSDKQSEISKHFAKTQLDKFINISYSLGDYSHCPLINDAVCYIECNKFKIYDAGDHNIIIGKVVNTIINSQFKPLIHCLREYRELK